MLDDLVALLIAVNLSAYTQSLRDTVEQAGGDPSSVALTNEDVAAQIEGHAQTTAEGIITTAESDVQAFLDGLPDDVSTDELDQLITEWSTSRAAWKNPHISISELALAVAQAQKDFVTRSDVTGSVSFGGSETCDVCIEIAGNSPYALDDPVAFLIPHPQCGDEWTLDITSTGDLWTGD